MILADERLARRLEAVDTWVGSESARARGAIRPEADTACLAAGGGYALYLGPDSPLNEAKGMGMAGPVSAGDLDAMTRVFHGRGAAAKVLVCPLADGSLLAGLADRGYRPSGFEHVLYRPLDRSERFPGPGGHDIAWAEADQMDLVGRTLARGFAAPGEPGPEMLEIVAFSSRIDGASGLLARVDGEPAAAAMLLISDGVALLGGASTLPAFRNRGLQTALAGLRLARAASAGCDVAMFGAEPGGTSQRNAERLGFRVAYTKLLMVLDPA